MALNNSKKPEKMQFQHFPSFYASIYWYWQMIHRQIWLSNVHVSRGLNSLVPFCSRDFPGGELLKKMQLHLVYSYLEAGISDVTEGARRENLYQTKRAQGCQVDN